MGTGRGPGRKWPSTTVRGETAPVHTPSLKQDTPVPFHRRGGTWSRHFILGSMRGRSDPTPLLFDSISKTLVLIIDYKYLVVDT